VTDTQTLALADFLLACIAEDEAEIAAGFDFAALDSSGWMGHAAGWGRERALAECRAKRQVIGMLQHVLRERPGDMAADYCLRNLGAVYVDHRGYRQDWRP
jgi:hypothetical protein